jgi:predicted RNA-binding Zn ribbon-like protein
MGKRPETAKRRLDTIEVVGGHPAIDFVNTVHSWKVEPPPDYLHGFDDFLEWSRMSGLLERKAAARFKAAPAGEKARAFREVLGLRQSLHDVFAAAAERTALPQRALDGLSDVIRRAGAWRALAADEKSGRPAVRGVWDFGDAPAIAALGPVAWLAADLLENGRLERLKECPGERCGWLFLDASRNRSRTWCSMQTCGNSAKVKRFRRRAKA